MILHICSVDEWMNNSQAAFYQPASYALEGFIHCCLEHQLAGVLDRYFNGKNDLYLLRIDETKLGAKVLYEGNVSGEKFPHVYGVINRSAIVTVEKMR